LKTETEITRGVAEQLVVIRWQTAAQWHVP